MGILDIAIIIGYFVLLMVISANASKNVTGGKDALAGGEGFGIITAGVGRTANMAGGPATVGNTTYGFTSGLAGSWFAISNVLSMWIAAPFAPRIYRAMKRAGVISIGGFLGHRFGKFTRIFAGLTNALAYTGFVASNILATGTVLYIILGWNFKTSMLATAAIVIFYTLSGGLKSVFKINVLQIAIMIIGFSFIMLPSSIGTAGGWEVIRTTVPESFLKLSGLGWATIIGTILIPTALTGFTTQAGFISVVSAKNLDTSWKATILGGIFYIFIAVPVIFVGMAAYKIMPNADAQNVLMRMVLETLPTGLIGILVAAIISATMSTAAACTLNAVTCFQKDVLEPLGNAAKDDVSELKRTRFMILVAGIIATIFAVLLPDLIELILIGYSLAAGGLLVPVFATMFWKRATSQGVIASMLGGGISFLVLKSFLQVSWPPLFLSIPLSLILLVIVSLLTEKQDPEKYAPYFEDTWKSLYPGKNI